MENTYLEIKFIY